MSNDLTRDELDALAKRVDDPYDNTFLADVCKGLKDALQMARRTLDAEIERDAAIKERDELVEAVDSVASSLERCTTAEGKVGDWRARCESLASKLRDALDAIATDRNGGCDGDLVQQ